MKKKLRKKQERKKGWKKTLQVELSSKLQNGTNWAPSSKTGRIEPQAPKLELQQEQTKSWDEEREKWGRRKCQSRQRKQPPAEEQWNKGTTNQQG